LLAPATILKIIIVFINHAKNISLLNEVIVKLANDEPLPEKYRDHALSGNWKGHRECHISPDWLLVYKKTTDGGLHLFLIRIFPIAI